MIAILMADHLGTLQKSLCEDFRFAALFIGWSTKVFRQREQIKYSSDIQDTCF